MARIPVTVPQLGEGVREARVLTRLKEPGQTVLKDEPLVEVETDKAVYVLEAPATGVVGEWLISSGVAAVGQVLTWILDPASPSQALRKNTIAPPKVWAWCAENSIPDSVVAEIPRPENGRLLGVEDIKRWIENTSTVQMEEAGPDLVPAWIEMPLCWDGLDAVRKQRRLQKLPASSISLLVWCVMRAARRHPRLRSLITGSRVVPSDHFHLGIAIAQPSDGLQTVVIRDTGSENYDQLSSQVDSAIQGEAESPVSVRLANLHLSYVAPLGIESAVPQIVPPSIATLAIGVPIDRAIRRKDDGIKWQKQARMVLGFDHRVMNGAGAAAFLRSVQSESKQLPQSVIRLGG